MTIKNFKIIWSILDKLQKIKLFYIIAIIFLSSFAELISIGSVIPVLSIIGDPKSSASLYSSYGHYINSVYVNEENFNNILILGFCILLLITGAFRIYQTRLITHFSFNIGLTISYKIYKSILFQDYAKHIVQNSSEIISSITMKVNAVVRGFIYPLLNIVSGTAIFLSIIYAVLRLSPTLSLFTLSTVGLAYILIYLSFRRTLTLCSSILSEQNTALFKVLNESLINIREVILGAKQNYFLKSYYTIDEKFRSAQARSFIIQTTPKFFIETSAMIIIVALATIFSKGSSGENSLIVMGAIVYGIQRLLPVMQLIYSSVSSMRTNFDAASDALKFVIDPNEIVERYSDLNLHHFDRIIMKNVSYKYPSSNHMSLTDISLEIEKGSKIAITGRTGSGKSTFADILAGLIEPTDGKIILDQSVLESLKFREWQCNVGYVGQNVNLREGTIAENVAFGVDKNFIDYSKVKAAIQRAGAEDFVNKLEDGVKSNVSENGLNFSGGQRQRIAIARAFYEPFEILIFDEATSALDKDTEQIIKDVIYSLSADKTVFIIAHGQEIISKCDMIIEFENGQIKSMNYPKTTKRK